MILRLAVLTTVLCAAPAWSATISWDCNPEPDMKEYRVESSKDAGKSWGIEATWPHPKPCTSPVSMGITRYMVPGERLFRLFAIDTAGNVARQPSEPASYAVKPSPIGNPGGQEEAALPPSPYKEAPVTPPPPVVPPPVVPPPIVLPPAPPPVPKPDAIKDFAVKALTEPGSAIISLIGPDDGTGKAALINVRTSPAGTGWGSMQNLSCISFPCTVTGIPVGTPQDFQAIPFRSTSTGSVFGDFTNVVTITLPAPPPVVTPPAPPGVTIKDALVSGFKACVDRKLANTACNKAVLAEIEKVKP